MSEEAEVGSTDFYVALGISAGLVVMAGVMSGLTMGLMSLDLTTLRVVAKTGDRRSRRYAAKIIPLVEKHHLLLVTLLLANASAMEALPIFLDKIVSPTISIILSVSLVLMFGEVIPQVGVAWYFFVFVFVFLFCWYFGMCCLCL
jgi:metal transporter CNNM